MSEDFQGRLRYYSFEGCIITFQRPSVQFVEEVVVHFVVFGPNQTNSALTSQIAIANLVAFHSCSSQKWFNLELQFSSKIVIKKETCLRIR